MLPKRLSLCTIWLLLFLQNALHAQGWQWQNPLPQGDNLNLVFFADRQHGWITSDGPILLHTRNGGKNWEILRTGIVFTDIHFINSLEGWGIGNARLDVIKWNIYHTTNGGATWEVQLADTTARQDIFFLDAKHGWVAKDETLGPDELLFTRNGGKTWEPQARGEFRPGDEIHSITFLDLQKGWVAGGLAIRTKDGGKTWKRDSTLVGVRQIFFADSLHGWARSFLPRIFRTIDGGQTWKRTQITDVISEVRSNQFLAFDTNRCFVALNIGLFASTDGGQSWVQHSSQELTSLAFLDSIEAWGVAGNGLYHSIDGGRSWQNLTKNILPDGVTFFSSVDFINAQIGWVAGLNFRTGVILRTSDGGKTWTEQWRMNGVSLEDIIFIDERNGWGVGSGGYIIHTSDGGQNWQKLNSGADFGLRAVTFVDSLHGWAVGDEPVENKGVILHTKNGGRTWFDQIPFDVSSISIQ